MRIGDGVWLVGSGALGAAMSSLWDSNVYALRAGAETWLIDAGVGHQPERIESELCADGITRIDKVLLTHGHLDHSGGAHHWRSRGAQIWAPHRTAGFLEAADEEAIHLPAARRDGIYPSDFRWTACPVDRRLEPGETIEAGGLRLEVIPAPGHSADMVCYLVARHASESLPALFSADAFFYGGRIAFAPTNADANRTDYERTLRRLLAEVPFDACYPGHGIWSARDGRRHLERAVDSLNKGRLPPNLD